MLAIDTSASSAASASASSAPRLRRVVHQVVLNVLLARQDTDACYWHQFHAYWVVLAAQNPVPLVVKHHANLASPTCKPLSAGDTELARHAGCLLAGSSSVQAGLISHQQHSEAAAVWLRCAGTR